MAALKLDPHRTGQHLVITSVWFLVRGSALMKSATGQFPMNAPVDSLAAELQ